MNRDYFGEAFFKGLKAEPELRFGSQQGNQINGVISDADPEHFAIGNRDGQWMIRDLPGDSKTMLDSSALDMNQPATPHSLPFDMAAFISDDVERPRFVFGFDPQVPDMWRLRTMGFTVKLEHLGKVHVSKRTGAVSGIEHITTTIQGGEFVGIYGESGAGKTTLVELLLGINEPDGGSVLVEDCEPRLVRSHLGYLPQELDLPRQLTCREVLELAAANRGVSLDDKTPYGKTLGDYVIDLSRFDREQFDNAVGNLSGGQYRRLCLACVLCKPELRLLIADEPTRGLDPLNEREVIAALRRISRSGTTVIVVTHSAECCDYFDRVLILRRPGANEPARLAFAAKWLEPRDAEQWNDPRYGHLKAVCPRLKSLIEAGNRIESLGFIMRPTSAKSMPEPVVLNLRLPQLPAAEREAGISNRRPAGGVWTWFTSCLLMHLRQARSIAAILALSVLSVCFMHLGCEHREADKLLLLFGIIAPWLSATYAAIYVNSLLRFHAFEASAGMRTTPFVLGVACSLIPVALLIGLPFAIGARWAPEKRAVLDSLLIRNQPFSGFAKEHLLDRRYEPQTPAMSSFVFRPMEVIVEKQLGLFPGVSPRAELNEATFARANWRPLWGLPLLCVFGVTIGVFAGCRFRRERTAITFCVVVFMTFLVLSRALIDGQSLAACMAPLFELPALYAADQLRLDGHDAPQAIAALGSFISYGRYAFNLLCFVPDKYEWMVCEAGVLVVCGLVLLGCTVFILSSERGVWRQLTRTNH